MFILGIQNRSVYEYELSAPYDITTATYTDAFSVATQATGGYGLFFKSDGTSFYIADIDSETIYQYNCSTAWDISTASYASKSFSVSSQSTDPRGLWFKPDGTKMYVGPSGTTDAIFQYSLSTAWDVSTASYDSVSLDVTDQESFVRAIGLNSDGTKLYVIGNSDTVYEYALPTAYVLTDGAYTGGNVDVSSQETTPNGFAFNDSDNKFYINGTGSDTVFEYSVGEYPTASPVTVTGLTNGTSYTFNVWAINAFGWSVASDASDGVSPAAPPIAIYAGGEPSGASAVNTMSFKDITSTGNFSDFGDLTVVLYKGAAVGTSTRAVFASGNGNNTMGYVNPQSTGNATDFGDLAGPRNTTQLRQEFGAAGNSTRGLFLGGGGISNVCDYITIATLGNTTDFGDLNTAVEKADGCGSPTRAICGGGADNGSNNTIQYRTFATLGNFSDFGDLTTAYSNDPAAFSSDTRGLIGGTNGNARMDYITIASTGNAAEFGNLSDGINYGPSGASSNTRGLVGGGSGWTAGANTVEYFTIASLGNATDFGNLSYSPLYHPTSASAGHGGLQ
jgi:sugar lactone lactonase YvrE